MTTSEKVAYLKGLIEGYGIAADEKQGKLLSVIMDILEDLAFDVEDIHDNLAELEDGLDAVSEDLEDVEDLLFGEDDFDDEDEEDWDDEDEELDAENLTLYEAQCPSCGEYVTFEESVLDQGGIICPNCGETLEFELDSSDDEE